MEPLGGRADHTMLHNVSRRMDELLEREELMWLQRSRIAWLKEGTEIQNTKYFHRRAAHRAKKNRIKLLRKEDGQTTKIKAEMEGMTGFFYEFVYG
jgi:hypothetical protein